MKNLYTESELSPEAINELSQLSGSYSHTNRIQDDFGIDDSWLDAFVEDYLGG